MPDWAPKAPIQFSNDRSFNHRAPDVSSGSRDVRAFDVTHAITTPWTTLRNRVVDAARLFRERLSNSGS
jgi:hypothetical protein